jgi:hypothetical protein
VEEEEDDDQSTTSTANAMPATVGR